MQVFRQLIIREDINREKRHRHKEANKYLDHVKDHNVIYGDLQSSQLLWYSRY